VKRKTLRGAMLI